MDIQITVVQHDLDSRRITNSEFHIFLCERCGTKSEVKWNFKTHKCPQCQQNYKWQLDPHRLPGDRKTFAWVMRRVYE